MYACRKYGDVGWSRGSPPSFPAAFNRSYTRRIGLLEDHLLDSDLTLPEMRVLWEISQSDQVTVSWLEETLGMDAGYLSRIVGRFRALGYVAATPDVRDRRVRRLHLTEKGRSAFAPLDRRSGEQVRAILDTMSIGDRARLVAAMQTIRQVLEKGPFEDWHTILRAPRPGDYGWVVERHGVLYAQEYGWDATFEGLVAGIVGNFAKSMDPARERCWIAESKGVRVGCIFLVQRSQTVAQLRLLLVEPGVRGHGVGAALVGECVRTARLLGYRRMVLWTNDILHSARRLYQREGFKLVRQEKHRSFGKRLVGQYWELDLRGRATSAAPATPARS